VLIHGDSRPRPEIVQPQQGKFSVISALGNVKVEVAPRRISITVIRDFLNQRDHVVDMFGRFAHYRRAGDVHAIRVVEESLGVHPGDFQHALAALFRALDHFIIA